MKRFVYIISVILIPNYLLAADKKIIENKSTSPVSFIGGVQNFLLGLAGGAAILFIVYGGMLYITSRGNKAQVEKAKKTLTYAIGGLILIILSGVIARFITGDLLGSII